jgi:hypothetical protein
MNNISNQKKLAQICLDAGYTDSGLFIVLLGLSKQMPD